MAPNLMQVPYDNERSFAAIGLVAAQPMIMVAGRSHPARTLAEYVARARANPGRETFANAGTGSSTHLAAELFFQEARLDVLDVGYRGSGPAIQAVISGESGMLILLAASALMGFIKSGEIRPLAVASAQRVSLAPDVPTFVESGFPAVIVREDMALLAPAGTPDAILDRLNSGMTRAMDSPDARERLAALGIEPGVHPRTEWPDYLRTEVSRWGELIKARNIRMQ
jgi:tripartite-type tricarboxylate transporter receptor subunit TctC